MTVYLHTLLNSLGSKRWSWYLSSQGFISDTWRWCCSCQGIIAIRFSTMIYSIAVQCTQKALISIQYKLIHNSVSEIQRTNERMYLKHWVLFCLQCTSLHIIHSIYSSSHRIFIIFMCRTNKYNKLNIL